MGKKFGIGDTQIFEVLSSKKLFITHISTLKIKQRGLKLRGIGKTQKINEASFRQLGI